MGAYTCLSFLSLTYKFDNQKKHNGSNYEKSNVNCGV
ncbi:MAG: hypothetical protein ACFWTJ_05920 [Lachnoclostridium sp.]|jgi:hypothetical protein